jgi:tRNA (5-methylaminomethyl-2-thiouridylate)-methyltransferase
VKIAVLLSGGVDSSVALRLLQREGETDITAYYLKIWLEDDVAALGHCPWEEDLGYARAVCDSAGVPLRVVPLQREYYERVVSYAVAELKQGRTPSPDIFCNERIKFGAFLQAMGDTCDRVATGHYARVGSDAGGPLLLRAPDPVKDQTYFLSHLRREQLARALFPVGGLLKKDVRRLARDLDLANKDRPDSQGICFLGKVRYPEFVRAYLGDRPGSIVEKETGRVLGTHRGYWFHTIGQRAGLGLSGGPWYVVAKDVAADVVYVSHASARQARSTFTASSLHWIAGPPARDRLLVRIRHAPTLVPCVVRPLSRESLEVTMEQPDAGIAAGQFAVLYDDEVCLGCGVIEG